MRADEYLMAPSLLDKSKLRDDNRRGIKQALKKEKNSRKGRGRWGWAQRGASQILNYWGHEKRLEGHTVA